MNKILGQISVTVLLLLVGTVRTSTAETLVVGEGLTQNISIPAGEAIVIDFVDTFGNSPIYQGERISLAAVREGTAFAGPASLIFANSTVVTFSRIRSSEFKTLILNSAQHTYVTNTVIVPEKKSIRIYPTSGGNAAIYIRSGIHSVVLNSGLGVDNSWRGRPVEFTGPLEIDFVGYTFPQGGQIPSRAIFTYCILDGEVAVNPDGVIKAPPGTVKLQVERSSTLTNWSPATVQQVWTDDSPGFFRLKVEK